MRRYTLFVGLLVLFAAARFAILLTSQTHVHSDEAIIGLMGKHILEGRYFPFYMYGQPYNAGAAWEAYLAAVAFAIFGVGVVPLKGCIVVLSLVTLFLFYQMCLALYEQRTALLAVIVFAVAPSLLKWHFQVRGYSWYFLSIPVLTLLFLSIESTPNRRWPLFLLFGIVSGLSIWSLELGAHLSWPSGLFCLLRRDLSLKNALVAAGGFLLGYAPAIAFNLTHHFANWNAVRERSAGGLAPFFRLEELSQIFLTEMPKFFGLIPCSGIIQQSLRRALSFTRLRLWLWPLRLGLYSIAVENRDGDSRRVRGRRGTTGSAIATAHRGVLRSVRDRAFPCAWVFFGWLLFFAALSGRLLKRCFASSKLAVRMGGVGISLRQLSRARW